MNVSIRAKEVRGIEVATSTPPRALIVDLEMTGDQCKDAILDLLEHDGEQAVFEWLKSVYPEWFEVAA